MAEFQVVFNADDLGMSTAANEGIHAAAEAGLVRETSLCVTGAAVEEGVRLARALGERLGVGLHLNLTEGTPLNGPLPGLTDRQGCFLGLSGALRACWLGRPDRGALVAEIRAQVGRLSALRLSPTHLNGHHHAHTFPVVREALLEVLAEAPLPYVRVPAEPPASGGRFSPRRALIARMARGLARRATAAGVPLRALPFRGLGLYARPDAAARLLRLASSERAATSEWMVHPWLGTADGPSARGHDLSAEGRALCDAALIAELRARGLRPGRYSELPGAQAGCPRTA